VTYRPTSTGGTAVDTLTAQYIAARNEIDPVLDSAAVLRSRDTFRPAPGGSDRSTLHHPPAW